MQPQQPGDGHARSLLNDRGLRPKKHLGQHFLMDGGSVKRIADLAVISREIPLVEAGPGTGALTRALASRVDRLIVVEIDGDMVDILRADQVLANVDIQLCDALKYDYDAIGRAGAWAATGNLPYNVGTPLLMKWIESEFPPERITVMVQRDVADRLAAKPNTPAYGSLSVATQLIMNVRRAFVLGPSVFFPRPKVDSAVVVVERRATPLVSGTLLATTREIVRAAFAYRRKTFANSLHLALGLERAHVQDTLRAIGLDTEIRGEQLDLDTFVAFAGALAS